MNLYTQATLSMYILTSTFMIESQLILKLKEKQESAFTKLVLATSNHLNAVAKLYLPATEDAEDILQDAYIICFEKIHSFKGNEPKAFYAWMKKITINLALSKHRNKLRKSMSPWDESLEDIAFDSRILSDLQRDDLMKLVFELPEGYRQVFGLFAIEGFNHREVANQLGIKESTSRSQLIRAKRTLQKKINHLQKLHVK